MDTTEITSWIDANLPETMLFIGGLLALLIVISYVKNDESWTYRFMMFLGVIFGVIMLYEAVTMYGTWRMATSLFVTIAGFALVIRPFREVHFAVIFALMVMVLVYIGLGGAVVYMIFNFAEAIVKLFGKVLNWWPLLMVLGIVCIVESAFMFLGYGSILDYIDTSSLGV